MLDFWSNFLGSVHAKMRVSCLNFEPWSRNFLIIVADVSATIMDATMRKSFSVLREEMRVRLE